MHEIRIAPMQRSRLSALLSEDRNDQFDAVAAGAQKMLKGRVVWNVNATAQGGGVAEMLQTLLAYGRFMLPDDVEGRRLIQRACGLFEDIKASGWIAEARASLEGRELASR